MAENFPPSVVSSLARQLRQLATSAPEGVRFVPSEMLNEIYADIEGPEKTPYEGGSFRVKLVLTKEYPAAPPKGFFLTKIFHPNVAATGDICVNTLKKDWTAETTLAHVLAVVRCLLIVPFPESSLNDDAGKLFMESYDEYFRRAKLMTSIHAMTATAGGKSSAGAASDAGAAAASASSATGGAGTVLDAAATSASSASSTAGATAVPAETGAVTALAGAKAANTSDAAPVAAATKPVAAVAAPAVKAPVAAAAAKKSIKRL